MKCGTVYVKSQNDCRTTRSAPRQNNGSSHGQPDWRAKIAVFGQTRSWRARSYSFSFRLDSLSMRPVMRPRIALFTFAASALSSMHESIQARINTIIMLHGTRRSGNILTSWCPCRTARTSQTSNIRYILFPETFYISFRNAHMCTCG